MPLYVFHTGPVQVYRLSCVWVHIQLVDALGSRLVLWLEGRGCSEPIAQWIKQQVV